MTGEKVLFAVAVGRAERLEHLPGAWTAARAMADCATAAGYRPYLVDDAGGEAVTIQRLRDTFQPVLEAPELIEHLIFYFAGHGFSRGTGDQILLLSGWRRDTNETIAVRLLHRRLSQYSVRRFTQIIDACSSLPGVETDDVGGADLFRTGDDRDNVAAQDVFQAAVHGRLAYMLRGDAQTAPVCLYSAVVMQALAGADAAADGAGRDVVRSQDIARHLTTNFKVMADRYGVTQRPTWTSGFLAPDDVYAKLPVAFRPPVLPEPKAAIAQSARDLAAEMPSEREIHSVEAGASIETTSGTTDVLARSQVSRLGSALAVAIALIQVVFAAAITVFAALIIINAYEIIAAYEPLHELFSRLHQLADERDLFQIVKMGLGAAAVIIAVWFMPGSLSSWKPRARVKATRRHRVDTSRREPRQSTSAARALAALLQDATPKSITEAPSFWTLRASGTAAPRFERHKNGVRAIELPSGQVVPHYAMPGCTTDGYLDAGPAGGGALALDWRPAGRTESESRATLAFLLALADDRLASGEGNWTLAEMAPEQLVARHPMAAVIRAYLADAAGDRKAVQVLAEAFRAGWETVPFDLALLADIRDPALVTGRFPLLPAGWRLLPFARLPVHPELADLAEGLVSAYPFATFQGAAAERFLTLTHSGEI